MAAVLSVPAFAQLDFSGEWAPLYHEDGPERLPGPELADYTELPINDAARMRGRHLRRRPHLRGPAIPVPPARRAITPCAASATCASGAKSIRLTQRLIAFHTHLLAWDSERTIWMDGRPHPPDFAPHTWQGFSTGVWEGNMLTITTTHLKKITSAATAFRAAIKPSSPSTGRATATT